MGRETVATDVAIVSRNTASAPKTYTVPGAQEIRPKAVSAFFDCTSAGVATFPALQLVSPAGDIVWTANSSSVSIAAGGSATISWFPHVGGGGLTASSNLCQWFLASRSTNLSYLSGEQKNVIWTTLKTSDSSLFSLTTTTNPNDTVNVARPGVVVWGSTMTQGALVQGKWSYFCIGGSEAELGTAGQNLLTDPTGATLTGTDLLNPRDFRFSVGTATPYTLRVSATNNDSVTRTIGSAEMGGVWISNSILFA